MVMVIALMAQNWLVLVNMSNWADSKYVGGW